MDKSRGLFMNRSGDTAEILIYEQIGLDPWDGTGIGAKQFAMDLKGLGKVDSILLKINSPGGDVFEGETIYNELKDHPAKINVRVMGLAASIASLIAMASDTIEMQDNSKMMIHKAWSIAIGNSDDMRKTAGVLDTVDEALVSVYEARTGQKASQIRQWMSDETWMVAKDAVARGFADSIVPAKEKVAAQFKLLKAFKNAPAEEEKEPDGIIERMRMRLQLAKAG